MVVPLGPGKFYGSSLPRPWIYTDVKLNMDRVDPPAPIFDPLLSWAREAHWSMGGLSFKRLRLQGRIEGNVKRLRAQREKQLKTCSPTPAGKPSVESPVAAPVAVKRKRFMALVDEEDEKEEEGVRKVGERKRLARRLREEFDEVAEKGPVKSEAAVVGRKRLRKRMEREADEVVERGSSASPAGTRVSPRLAKRL